MTNIDPMNLKNYAAELFDKLDAKDGKMDGKVNNSVWNEFAENEQTQGNTIKNYIERDNGIKAIVRYINAQCEKLGVDLENYVKPVFENVVNGIKGVPTTDSTPPKDTKPPLTDSNPPQKDSNPPTAINIIDYPQNKALAGEKIIVKENGAALVYDEDGYVIEAYDENGNKTREIFRNADGTIYTYINYEYDENGNCTKEISYNNADGTVSRYRDYEYDENGNKTREIEHNADGTVSFYRDYEYDENGNKTREILRNEDGTVENFDDYEYDENGNNTKEIWHNADGTVRRYNDYEYDENGNKTRDILRYADGTLYTYYDD